jgi:trk system potassium uptake protein TrkA
MRSVYEETQDYAEYVDEIVFPERAGARSTVNVIESELRAIEGTTARVELLEIRISPDAPVVGQRLDEVGLPRGSLVVTDIEQATIASGDTELRAGQTYVVAAEAAVTDEVRRLFRG